MQFNLTWTVNKVWWKTEWSSFSACDCLYVKNDNQSTLPRTLISYFLDWISSEECKMLALINRILDWFKSLFWKEEMELTLVGLQYSGKTTFVNVIAVRLPSTQNILWLPIIFLYFSDVDVRKTNDLFTSKLRVAHWHVNLHLYLVRLHTLVPLPQLSGIHSCQFIPIFFHLKDSCLFHIYVLQKIVDLPKNEVSALFLSILHVHNNLLYTLVILRFCSFVLSFWFESQTNIWFKFGICWNSE